MTTQESIDKAIASYHNGGGLSYINQNKAWKRELSEQLKQASECAPDEYYSDNGRIDFKVNGGTGLDFQLRLFNHKATIQGYLAKVDKLPPKASRLPCARVPRKTRTAVEEALLVYGSPARALDALRPQLASASELGLDEVQQRKLDALIYNLEGAST